MVEVTHYTATARRDGRWWVVQCDQYPGALSQVARLEQAAEVHREAIAFVAEVDESDVEVEVRPMLDPELANELRIAEELAAQADEADRRAREMRRDVARKLADSGMTVRDVGAVLGVSYQRAHQLVNPSIHKTATKPDNGRAATRRSQSSAPSGKISA